MSSTAIDPPKPIPVRTNKTHTIEGANFTIRILSVTSKEINFSFQPTKIIIEKDGEETIIPLQGYINKYHGGLVFFRPEDKFIISDFHKCKITLKTDSPDLNYMCLLSYVFL